jgi:tRNA (guanine-N7-)-methyltransferase
MRAMEACEGAAAVRLMLYGRRRGRAMRPGHRHLLETRLPSLGFALPRTGALQPHTLFPAPVDAIWLELGFGGGEHLAAQAEAHRAIGVIGAEIFENGVAKLLADIERRALGNVRIFMGDARLLVASLAEASIARAFILFPDPWPKERHKKRRLVSHDFLGALARAMTDDAELRLATDDMDYARAMLALGCDHRDFRWQAAGPGDWRERPGDWPATRYERKAIAAGRKPLYLRFQRRARTT